MLKAEPGFHGLCQPCWCWSPPAWHSQAQHFSKIVKKYKYVLQLEVVPVALW